MLNLELCRVIKTDRDREVERALQRRRLLEVLAIQPASRASERTAGTRDVRPGATAALDSAG